MLLYVTGGFSAEGPPQRLEFDAVIAMALIGVIAGLIFSFTHRLQNRSRWGVVFRFVISLAVAAPLYVLTASWVNGDRIIFSQLVIATFFGAGIGAGVGLFIGAVLEGTPRTKNGA
jgi:hypothetical protein